jgi:hypothetical protein
MKWPVSAERHALLQHNMEEMRKEHHRQMSEEKARYAKDIDFYRAALALKDTRYDTLLQKYEALANPQSARPALVIPTRKPADIAIETVVAQFGGSSRLRRQLQRFVTTERSLEGANEDAIADRVLHWREVEEADATA